MMNRFLQVWYRNYQVWRRHVAASLIGNLGQPVLFLLAMGYGLGRQVGAIGELTYLQFIAPGLVASAVMYSAAFEATYGAYTRLATQKTYEAILMTPVTVEELAMGEIVWGASKGLISGLIMLAAFPLFGLWPSTWTLGLLPILFLEGLFFAAFGLIMTALASNYEFFNYFNSLIITPFFLFSGIFFPLASLEPKSRALFRFLPLTPVVSLSRMFSYGRINPSWAADLAIIAVLAVITGWLATRLLRRRLIL
jgi:lipooligosaccharide transport system permease protein